MISVFSFIECPYIVGSLNLHNNKLQEAKPIVDDFETDATDPTERTDLYSKTRDNLLENRKTKEHYTNLACQILKNCNVFRQKHCRNLKVLKQGEGKLMHTAGIALKESSSRIYTKILEKMDKSFEGDTKRGEGKKELSCFL